MPRLPFLRPAGALVAVAVLAAACAGSDVVISAEELNSLLQSGDAKPLVLDVRTQREYAGGHVPGAVNIPHTQLQPQLSALQSAAANGIVVYCEVGTRSQYAMSLLQQAGLQNVRHLAGDMAGWRRSGLPMAR